MAAKSERPSPDPMTGANDAVVRLVIDLLAAQRPIWPRAEMARRINERPATLAQYLTDAPPSAGRHGRREMPLRVIRKIAAVFGLTEGNFLALAATDPAARVLPKPVENPAAIITARSQAAHAASHAANEITRSDE